MASWLVRLALIATTTLTLGACSTPPISYTPDPSASPIRPADVPLLAGTGTIEVVNVQADTMEVSIVSKKLMGSTQNFAANLHAWTDTAIAHAERALRSAGYQLSANTPKKLKLSITKADLQYGWVLATCLVTLHVETSDGSAADFNGEGNATAGVVYLPRVAMDGAASDAVSKMLNDKGILEFLKR